MKKKLKNQQKILDIIKKIIKFNEKSQSGRGLKTLTPDQMLSRLPITLAQFKAGNNSEKLKMKLDNYCILCIDQKNLQNNSIKV